MNKRNMKTNTIVAGLSTVVGFVTTLSLMSCVPELGKTSDTPSARDMAPTVLQHAAVVTAEPEQERERVVLETFQPRREVRQDGTCGAYVWVDLDPPTQEFLAMRPCFRPEDWPVVR